jgi:mono/diheme cytochrome c family protein
MLSLRSSKDMKQKKELVNHIMDNNKGNEVIDVIGKQSIIEEPLEIERIKKKYILENSITKGRIIKGYKNFKSICAACHGVDAKGVKGLAPPLVGCPRLTGNPEITLKIILNGLTGPIDGKEYAGVMAGMKQEDNEWIAEVSTYIRMYLNNASQIRPGQVERIRKKIKGREAYWTLEELSKKVKK